jgi:hypothetical protein
MLDGRDAAGRVLPIQTGAALSQRAQITPTDLI